jgi:hypothetical protein
MKRLLVTVLIVGACSSVAPTVAPVTAPLVTPAPTASPTPPASPSAATPALTPEPTPTPVPAARLRLVPCTFDLAKDPECRGDYHVTDTVEVGSVVTLTFMIKNAGSKVSGPVSGMMFGCTSFGGCTHTEYFLPDRFTLIGCKPSCRGQVVNDRTTWYLEWAGKIKPGKTVKLTVAFRADYVAYNYVVAGLYDAPIATLDADLFAARGLLIQDWGNIQVVVFPK